MRVVTFIFLLAYVSYTPCPCPPAVGVLACWEQVLHVLLEDSGEYGRCHTPGYSTGFFFKFQARFDRVLWLVV